MELISTNRGETINERLVYSPQTNEPIYKVSFNSHQSVNKIIEDAKIAQEKWSRLTTKSRIKFLHKYIQLLNENREQIIELIQKENGKLKSEANAEIEKAIELAEFALSIPTFLVSKTEYVSRGVEVKERIEPIGIVAVITPFNFPLMVPHWNILNAIVTGNIVILKPSTQTPKTMLFINELLIEAGLPQNIFNIVYGEEEVVNNLIKHKQVSAITFVGSSEVAKIVYEQAATNYKRSLALGGAKNHTIVANTTDYDAIVSELVESAFGMSGQRCMATSVLSIVGSHPQLIEKLIEKTNERADYAAVINKQAIRKIEEFMQSTEATVLLNGLFDENGNKILTNYIRPSIVEYKNANDVLDIEIFGPLLEIFTFETLDQAIKFQNKSKYGNGATIYTNKGQEAEQVLKLSSGMLGVNIGVPVPREPFGFSGLKYSKYGYGDISGFNSLEFFINRKKITTKWNSNNKIDWTS